MSNWVAMEWEKLKAWVEAHAKSTNSRLDALEQRVTALEQPKVAKDGTQTPAAAP